MVEKTLMLIGKLKIPQILNFLTQKKDSLMHKKHYVLVILSLEKKLKLVIMKKKKVKKTHHYHLIYLNYKFMPTVNGA